MVYPPQPPVDALAALARARPDLHALVLDYEAELDVLFPGWRAAVPGAFERLDVPSKMRAKWLAKRRMLLLHNVAGVPQPRDWPVLVAQGSGGRIFAHPLQPPPDPVTQTTDPPSPVAWRRP